MPGPSQHVVSRGYLRNFTDDDGLIQVVWRETLEPVMGPTGVGVVFRSKNFNTYWSAEGQALYELEAEWGRVENIALPHLRRAAEGHVDDDVTTAIKVTAVMHLARSFATRRLWEASIENHRALDDEARKRLAAAYEEEEGRAPGPGEVDAAFGAHFDAHIALNQAFVEEVVSTNNRLLDELPNHVQLVRRNSRSPVGFITADIPVALMDKLRVGILAGVGVRSADGCLMPLSRDVAAFLTTKREPDVHEAPVWVVQMLNHIVWRGALRQIACHPAEDWHRALGRSSSG